MESNRSFGYLNIDSEEKLIDSEEKLIVRNEDEEEGNTIGLELGKEWSSMNEMIKAREDLKIEDENRNSGENEWERRVEIETKV